MTTPTQPASPRPFMHHNDTPRPFSSGVQPTDVDMDFYPACNPAGQPLTSPHLQWQLCPTQMPKFGHSCIGALARLTKDMWIGQLFWERSTFLPTSHHHPRVRRQIQPTAIWIALFVCVNHLPEPSLSSELDFHVSESVCECWCLCLRVCLCSLVHVCRCSHMNKCTEQSQSLTKLLEKLVPLLIERRRQFYLWICQRHYLNFFNKGSGENTGFGRRLQPWNISGFKSHGRGVTENSVDFSINIFFCHTKKETKEQECCIDLKKKKKHIAKNGLFFTGA